MIEGIELLDTIQVRNCSGWWVIVAFAVAIVIFIIGLKLSDYYCKSAIFFTGMIISVLIVIFVVPALAETSTRFHTEYKVKITDEMKYNEFVNKYKIVDKEGKIYTIKENKK